MTENSKHIISNIIFIIFAVVYVFLTESPVVSNSIVCAVSVASLLISISDLINAKADIDKRELLLNQYAFNVADRMQKKALSNIVQEYGEEAKQMIAEMSESEINKMLEQADKEDEDERQDNQKYSEAVKAANKRLKLYRIFSTSFYILSFSILPIILALRDCLGNVETTNNVLTLLAFAVVLLTMVVKNEYRKGELRDLMGRIAELRRMDRRDMQEES